MKSFFFFLCLISFSWGLNPIENATYSNSKQFDIKQFEELGKKHNSAVKYILSNISSYNEETILNEISSKLKLVLPQEYQLFNTNGKPLDIDFFNTVRNGSNEKDLKKYLNSLSLSPQLKVLVSEMLNQISNGNTFQKIQESISNIERDAKVKLNNNDLALFYSTSTVARYSAKFWLPTEQGGEGGIRYLNSNNGTPNEEIHARIWGRVIMVDALGVLSGAGAAVINSGGAAAIPNPAFGGLPTASVVGLWVGALASAAAALP